MAHKNMFIQQTVCIHSSTVSAQNNASSRLFEIYIEIIIFIIFTQSEIFQDCSKFCSFTCCKQKAVVTLQHYTINSWCVILSTVLNSAEQFGRVAPTFFGKFCCLHSGYTSTLKMEATSPSETLCVSTNNMTSQSSQCMPQIHYYFPVIRTIDNLTI